MRVGKDRYKYELPQPLQRLVEAHTKLCYSKAVMKTEGLLTRPEIDKPYLEEVVKLPTEVLILIQEIDSSRHGLKRARETLNWIDNELTKRAIFGDDLWKVLKCDKHKRRKNTPTPPESENCLKCWAWYVITHVHEDVADEEQDLAILMRVANGTY